MGVRGEGLGVDVDVDVKGYVFPSQHPQIL